MPLALIIIAQLLFVSFLILLFFRVKDRFGYAPLYVLLGSNQYFQTVLATSYKIKVFGNLSISAGSSILFSAGMFALLLMYIKEGVRSTQRLILAIVLANLSFTILSLLVNQQELYINGTPSGLYTINIRIFLAGTLALILDSFLLVILYEFFFSKVKWLNLYTRLFLAMFITLNFDAVLFVTGSFWDLPGYSNILLSHLFTKSVASVFFASFLFIYLRYFDKTGQTHDNLIYKGREDIFSILTYKGRYEKLISDKALSDEQMQKNIAEKALELEESVKRFTILSSVKELRIDKYSSIDQAKEFLIKIKEAFKADACTIHQLKDDQLTLLTSIGISEEHENELPFSYTYLEEIIKYKKPVAIEDTRRNKAYLNNGANTFHYISCLGCPMLSGSKVIGILKLYSINHKRIYTPLEIEHLSLAASQMAQSQENSILFEQNEKHKEILVKQIVARKKVEEAIKESEEKYRTLTEAIPDYIMRYDKEGRLTYMNQAALEISGKTANDVIGKTHLEAGYDKEQSAFWDKKINNVFKTREPYEEQFSWESANGLVYLDWRLTPEIDKKGNVVSVLGVSRDITNLKKAEENIRRSYERLELIGKAANDALWEWNLETNEIWGNEAHQQLYGLTLADPVPDDEIWKKNLHDNDRQRILDSLEETFASDKNIWDGEYLLNTVNKGWINIFGRTYIERNKEGKPNRLLGSMIDITDRKKQEEILERSEQNLRQVLTSITDIFYVIDRNYRIILMNKTANELLSKAWGTVVVTGKNILELIPTNGDEPIQESFEKVFAGESIEYEHHRSSKELEGWFLVGYHPVISDKGEIVGAYVVTKDITERRKVQEQFIKYNNQLRDLTSHLLSIREEERRRIGREIHDDLGQQLTAIKMDVAWIDQKIPVKAEVVKSKLKNIIGLLDGSNQSVRRILNELKPSILDEYGLLDAMEWHANQFRESTAIEVQLKTSAIEIKLNEEIATCIFRLFQEALTNVARHSKAKKVVASVELMQGEIVVSIEDDGIGFDVTKVQSNGSFGILGMKERVRAVDGTIEINSILGNGTTIIIKIPINKELKNLPV